MEKFTQAPVGLDIDQTVSSNSSAIANIDGKATVNAKQYTGNLNTLKSPGVYACNNCTNTPGGSSGWFSVEVIPMGGADEGNTNYPTQIAIQLSSGNTYIRSCSNGAWGSWQKLVTNSELENRIAFFVASNGESGRYYTVNFAISGATTTRSTVLVLHGHQSGINFPPEVVTLNETGGISTQENAHVSQDTDASWTLKIDNGINAWVAPILIYNPSVVTFSLPS